MSARDELTRILMSPESFDGGPVSCGPNSVYAARTAEAILAAGYRKPRIINSREELDGLPEESVVIDYESDVSQKRGGLWCGYETTPLNSTRLARIAGPFTVLHEPGATK